MATAPWAKSHPGGLGGCLREAGDGQRPSRRCTLMHTYGNGLVRRLTAFRPRWEEPLSAILSIPAPAAKLPVHTAPASGTAAR